MMRINRVSTSFLQNSHTQEVLILRRSLQQRQFPGFWAGVSGSIEGSETPFSSAIREIWEETRLEYEKDFRLVCKGRPLLLQNEEYDREYHIYPFLFSLSPSAVPSIRIDWEHCEYIFIPPEEKAFNEHQTVPLLYEGFSRVFLPLPDPIADFRTSISNNHRDGASKLSLIAVDAVVDALTYIINHHRNQNTCIPCDKALLLLLDVSYQFSSLRKNMRSIENTIANLCFGVHRRLTGPSTTWGELLHLVQDELTSVREHSKRVKMFVTDHFLRYKRVTYSSRNTYLTLSCSHSVYSVLKELERNSVFFVAESRPLGEGRDFLLRLLSQDPYPNKNNYNFLHDTAIVHCINTHKKNLVAVIGADCIFQDGSFINKIGSHGLALACHFYSIPLFILSDTSKISWANHPEAIKLEPAPLPTEKSFENINVTFTTPLFEVVPYFENFIFLTECGVLTLQEIRAIAFKSQIKANFLKYGPRKSPLRPQDLFFDPIDNSSLRPFVSAIKVKPNALLPLLSRPFPPRYHPYEHEIKHLEMMDMYTTREPTSLVKELKPTILVPENDSFVFVDTLDAFQRMRTDLNLQPEFAIDTEQNNDHSFLGFTCLVQISTRNTDYIIDTLVPDIRASFHQLNDCFTNPSIVKVIHGADDDLPALQRDFSLYCVNLFDTEHSARFLHESHSLMFQLDLYCGIVPDPIFKKRNQQRDWRQRPLDKEALLYARRDTHYLLYIYHRMKADLLANLKTEISDNRLELTLERSREATLRTYEKHIPFDHWKKANNLKIGFKNFRKTHPELDPGNDHKQHVIIQSLYLKRDSLARLVDSGVHTIISKYSIFDLALKYPKITSLSLFLEACSKSRELPYFIRFSNELYDCFSLAILHNQIFEEKHFSIRSNQKSRFLNPKENEFGKDKEPKKEIQEIENKGNEKFTLIEAKSLVVQTWQHFCKRSPPETLFSQTKDHHFIASLSLPLQDITNDPSSTVLRATETATTKKAAERRVYFHIAQELDTLQFLKTKNSNPKKRKIGGTAQLPKENLKKKKCKPVPDSDGNNTKISLIDEQHSPKKEVSVLLQKEDYSLTSSIDNNSLTSFLEKEQTLPMLDLETMRKTKNWDWYVLIKDERNQDEPSKLQTTDCFGALCHPSTSKCDSHDSNHTSDDTYLIGCLQCHEILCHNSTVDKVFDETGNLHLILDTSLPKSMAQVPNPDSNPAEAERKPFKIVCSSCLSPIGSIFANHMGRINCGFLKGTNILFKEKNQTLSTFEWKKLYRNRNKEPPVVSAESLIFSPKKRNTNVEAHQLIKTQIKTFNLSDLPPSFVSPILYIYRVFFTGFPNITNGRSPVVFNGDKYYFSGFLLFSPKFFDILPFSVRRNGQKGKDKRNASHVLIEPCGVSSLGEFSPQNYLALVNIHNIFWVRYLKNTINYFDMSPDATTPENSSKHLFVPAFLQHSYLLNRSLRKPRTDFLKYTHNTDQITQDSGDTYMRFLQFDLFEILAAPSFSNLNNFLADALSKEGLSVGAVREYLLDLDNQTQPKNKSLEAHLTKVQGALHAKLVTTTYSTMPYPISNIDFRRTPADIIIPLPKENKSVSLGQFLKNRHGILITDTKQPVIQSNETLLASAIKQDEVSTAIVNSSQSQVNLCPETLQLTHFNFEMLFWGRMLPIVSKKIVKDYSSTQHITNFAKNLSKQYPNIDFTSIPPLLLREAFTSPSNPDTRAWVRVLPLRAAHYRRLEFFGDSLLDLVIGLKLYHLHPTWSEGALTQNKSKIIRNKNLAQLSQQLNFPSHILWGENISQNENNNTKSQADVYESLIGAILVSLGINQAVSFVEQTLFPESVEMKYHSSDIDDVLNRICPDTTPYFEFCQTLGHTVKKSHLILKAFIPSSKDITEPAFYHEYHHIWRKNSMQDKLALLSHQRLEFLGDQILKFCATAYCFYIDPWGDPEALSDRRARLINNLTLTEVAHNTGLSNLIFNRPDDPEDKVYADSCEALIGAIFLDEMYSHEDVKTVLQFCQGLFIGSYSMKEEGPYEIRQDYDIPGGFLTKFVFSTVKMDVTTGIINRKDVVGLKKELDLALYSLYGHLYQLDIHLTDADQDVNIFATCRLLFRRTEKGKEGNELFLGFGNTKPRAALDALSSALSYFKAQTKDIVH